MEEQKLNFYQQNLIKRRNFIIYLTTLLGSGALALKLWDLQIIDRENYSTLAQENRIRVRLVAAPRGSIFDNQGIVLATNQPTFDLFINLEEVEDQTLLAKKLGYVLNLPYEKVKKIITRPYKNKFLPVPLKANISYEQMALFSSFTEEFPGILIEHSLIRDYPMKEKASHFLGFVNWSGSEKEDIVYPKNQIASYQKTGQSGVESAFNEILTGFDGGIENEVNSSGQPVRVLEEIPPGPGSDINLTIDSRLQEFIYDNMEHRGSVIVTRPQTHEILSMVSKPGFNPNLFLDRIDPELWQKILDDEDKTLTDRCLRGVYSPGSTFKVLMALAGLSENTITPSTTVFCPGWFRQGRQIYQCWKHDGHGSVNVVEALQHSCNVFFYQLGKNLGIQNIETYAKNFGFGSLTGIPFPHELSGILPSPKWKQEKIKQSWLPGDTINVSIGQGFLTVTPLQLLHYLNGILNNGPVASPEVLKKISKGSQVQEFKIPARKNSTANLFYFDLVRKGMHLCVNGVNGTGASAKSNSISIGGKTGTTQVISFRTRQKVTKRDNSILDKYKNHGWFMGYAPSDLTPEVSIVVLLENVGTSAVAAAFAKKVLEHYFETKKQNAAL